MSKVTWPGMRTLGCGLPTWVSLPQFYWAHHLLPSSAQGSCQELSGHVAFSQLGQNRRGAGMAPPSRPRSASLWVLCGTASTFEVSPGQAGSRVTVA